MTDEDDKQKLAEFLALDRTTFQFDLSLEKLTWEIAKKSSIPKFIAKLLIARANSLIRKWDKPTPTKEEITAKATSLLKTEVDHKKICELIQQSD